MKQSIPILPFQANTEPDLGFEIIQTGSFPAGHHKHDFFEIQWITEGTSIQHIDFQEVEIPVHHLVILPQGSVHGNQSQGEHSALLLLFTEDFLEKDQKHLLQSPIFDLFRCEPIWEIPSALHSIIDNYFELMLQISTSPTPIDKRGSLNQLLGSFITFVESIYEGHHPVQIAISKSRQTYHAFRNLLEVNFRKERKIQFYADQLNMSSKTLANHLQETIQQSPLSLIIRRIILEAKRELRYSNFTVREISFALGFQDEYYFSRLFKEKTGQSPREFRSALSK